MIDIIIDKYGVVFHEDESLKNNCAFAGKEIFIGKYDNKEFLLISIFHEIGHILITQDFKRKCLYNTMLIEMECWSIGIKEALELGIVFSDSALKFACDKIMGYCGHDLRECGQEHSTKLPEFEIPMMGDNYEMSRLR